MSLRVRLCFLLPVSIRCVLCCVGYISSLKRYSLYVPSEHFAACQTATKPATSSLFSHQWVKKTQDSRPRSDRFAFSCSSCTIHTLCGLHLELRMHTCMLWVHSTRHKRRARSYPSEGVFSSEISVKRSARSPSLMVPTANCTQSVKHHPSIYIRFVRAWHRQGSTKLSS